MFNVKAEDYSQKDNLISKSAFLDFETSELQHQIDFLKNKLSLKRQSLSKISDGLQLQVEELDTSQLDVQMLQISLQRSKAQMDRTKRQQLILVQQEAFAQDINQLYKEYIDYLVFHIHDRQVFLQNLQEKEDPTEQSGAQKPSDNSYIRAKLQSKLSDAKIRKIQLQAKLKVLNSIKSEVKQLLQQGSAEFTKVKQIVSKIEKQAVSMQKLKSNGGQIGFKNYDQKIDSMKPKKQLQLITSLKNKLISLNQLFNEQNRNMHIQNQKLLHSQQQLRELQLNYDRLSKRYQQLRLDCQHTLLALRRRHFPHHLKTDSQIK